MSEWLEKHIGVVLPIFIGMFIAVFVMMIVLLAGKVPSQIQKQAIENQCARFNPETGHFERINP